MAGALISPQVSPTLGLGRGNVASLNLLICQSYKGPVLSNQLATSGQLAERSGCPATGLASGQRQ